VTATIDGVDFGMIYQGGGVYDATIRLQVDWGDLTVSFTATAVNCSLATDQVIFEVLEKDLVHLTVSSGTPVEGEATQITAELTYTNSQQTEATPLDGQAVRFRVRVWFNNGTVYEESYTDTTNDQGTASWSFLVPTSDEAEATNMTVDAWYDGSLTRWAARAETYTIPVGLDPLQQLFRFLTSEIGLLLIGALLIVGVVSVGYNRRFKPRKFAAKTALEKQLEAFMELEMVQHFMAVYTDRGTCVFYHPFAQSRIQPDLISGFIAAITSVYGEIKGDGVQGSLEEINYQGLRLNSYSGRYIIGIMIVEGEMSPRLRDRLQFFVEIFEDQYESDLDGWTGLVDCFDPEWVVSNLNTAFNYDWMLPHYVDPKVRLKGPEKKIVNLIKDLYGRSEFLVRDILTNAANKLGSTEAEAFDIILRIMDRGAIYPISIHTVLQRQGMGIADEEDESIYEVKTAPEIDEPEPSEEAVEPGRVEKVVEPEKVEEVTEPEPVEEPPAEVKEELTEEEKFLKEVEDLISKETDDSD
jgi:hypothetical protein